MSDAVTGTFSGECPHESTASDGRCLRCGKAMAPVWRQFGIKPSDRLAYLGLPYEVQSLPDRIALLEARMARLERCLRRAANLRRASKEKEGHDAGTP